MHHTCCLTCGATCSYDSPAASLLVGLVGCQLTWSPTHVGGGRLEFIITSAADFVGLNDTAVLQICKALKSVSLALHLHTTLPLSIQGKTQKETLLQICTCISSVMAAKCARC